MDKENRLAEPLAKAKGFGGYRVAAFEARFAQEMAKLISSHGGEPLVAPAMAEIPLEQNVSAFDFAERLFRDEIAINVFTTGVGTRTLFEVLETRYAREQLVEALRRTTVVARGPKPVSVLRTYGVSPDVVVPEPNTWREILAAIDSGGRCPALTGATLALQEYGVPNSELLQELRKRGANVLQVPVYRWALPEDTAPLAEAIRRLIVGDCQVALFTNAMQVSHLFQVAGQTNAEALREALRRIVVGSVGPICSQALRDVGVEVDLEPRHPKMGYLLAEAAAQAHTLLKGKSRPQDASDRVDVKASVCGDASRPGDASVRLDKLEASAFMRACRQLPTSYRPIWLMRQAGRYMPEYRAIRAKNSFLDLCKNSDLAAEVTVTAAHRLGVDAAIIFADILLIVEPMGLGLRFEKGDGPSIDGAIRSPADVRRLRDVEPEESLGYVFDAVRKTRAGLRSDIPLIGFTGAPFTLASYMVEGGASKNYRHTKSLMYGAPSAWHAMMSSIARSLVKYLNGQVAAGAQAVQLFDSWVGCLGPDDYREFVLPYTRQVIEGVRSGVPVINFSTGTSSYLEMVSAAGGNVIGVDWRVDLAEAWSRIGPGKGLQGNLDPLILFADRATIKDRALRLLAKAAGRHGYIFNLGHGILPETPVDNVLELVDTVHEWSD